MSENTKLLIAKKMQELMKEKAIDHIRITEICELAGIERSTFYYHFKDKYDLVAWVFYHSVSYVDVIDPVASAAQMRRMKDNLLFYRRAFADTSEKALWQYMVRYFVDEYVSVAKARLNVDALNDDLLYSIRLFSFGMISMLREWILDDNAPSAEAEVYRMYNAMPTSMHNIFFGR